MNVLIEGHICTRILSYTHLEYLFTATVCLSWKENSQSVYTDVAAAFEAPSRIQEAVESGISCQCYKTGDGLSCDFFMEYAELVDADVEVYAAIHEMGFGWGKFTMQNAAIGRKLDVIRYMFEHGCPLNNSVLFNAVKANCLELVHFLAEHNCPIDDTPIETTDERSPDYNVRSFELAVARNHLDIVECLRSRLNFPFNENTFRAACNADFPKNLHVLEYLHSQGCTPPPFLLYEMIDNGNFHAVKFMLGHHLYDNKCATAMCIAVSRFQANIMRLLVDYGFDINNDVVDYATYDMGITKWLLRVSDDSECRLTSNAYINTIEYNMVHTHCIQALDWLFYHWKLEIGFGSLQELLHNERWSQALTERDPSITEWFRDKLHK